MELRQFLLELCRFNIERRIVGERLTEIELEKGVSNRRESEK